MELEVQKYLRSGKTIDDLKDEFAIKRNSEDHLVCLNYNQIDSPKDHVIVRECRGLILEKDTWNVVAMPFRRFFNYGEFFLFDEKFNFKDSYVLEKIDGSLINLFFYDGLWRISTRGIIDASGCVGFCNMTFKNLFDKTVLNYEDFYKKLDVDYNYVFELVSPENRIVTPYKNREIVLLMARNTKTMKEINYEEILKIGNNLEVRVPKIFHFGNIDEIRDYLNGMDDYEEGFVCVDYSKYDEFGINFNRLKIKNPEFVLIASLKEKYGFNARSLFELVMFNEYDEFLSYFPEYEKVIMEMREKYEKHLCYAMEKYSEYKHIDNKKDFAMKVKGTGVEPILFAMYDGKAINPKDYYVSMVDKKGVKLISKKILKILNIDFEDFF